MSKSFPNNTLFTKKLTSNDRQQQQQHQQQPPLVFTFPNPSTSLGLNSINSNNTHLLNTPTTPGSAAVAAAMTSQALSNAMTRSIQGIQDSRIPIKKRYFDMAPPPSQQQQSESIQQQDNQINYDLSDWQKCHVLAMHRRLHGDEKKQLSSSYPNYSKLESELDEVCYYPATIETTNGSVVKVVFDVSIEQLYNKRPASRLGLELTSSQPSLSSHYEQTYDITREDEKYSIIDNAQPPADQLEKGITTIY